MLQVVTREEAVRCVRAFAQRSAPLTETVRLPHAYARVLAADVIAAGDVPAFDRSTMDGYAVCAVDTFGASGSTPSQLEIAGEVAMGKAAGFSLRRGQCARIPTGGMLPAGADAVVMVEQTDEAEGLCLVYKSVFPGENVTRRGDDVACGTAVLRKGTRLLPQHVGVLAALGQRDVCVFRKPIVAVISTGDEIVRDEPAAGQVQDVNSDLLCALLAEYGCEPFFGGVVRDERAAILDAVRRCLACSDAVLLSGGSSAGTRDLTVSVLQELGDVFFHGIAMKPGKPTIFGAADGKPVFGLPGHPLAAFFVFRLIVSQYLDALCAVSPEKPQRTAPLCVNVPSNHGREEYLCVRINENGEAVPLHTKSGIISVLSAADGFIRIPRDTEGVDKGTVVEVYEI